MKAMLKFTLPEEKEEYEMAVHGIDYYLCLNNIREWLRQKLKYGSEGLDTKTLEVMQETFFKFLEDHDVNL